MPKNRQEDSSLTDLGTDLALCGCLDLESGILQSEQVENDMAVSLFKVCLISVKPDLAWPGQP